MIQEDKTKVTGLKQMPITGWLPTSITQTHLVLVLVLASTTLLELVLLVVVCHHFHSLLTVEF